MNQMSDLIIFCPVGTSLLTNQGQDPDDENAKNAISKIIGTLINNQELTKYFNNSNIKDQNPAEISSLYAFCRKHWTEINGKTIGLHLLHSPDIGEACAEAIRDLIKTPRYFSCYNQSQPNWQIELHCLVNLNPRDTAQFSQAIQNLAGVIKEEVSGFTGPVYLNITGGYKALSPYLTMLGLALGSAVKIFYLFAEARETIELPAFPMAFDLLEWRDWRGLLLPFTLNLGLTREQKESLRRALEKTKLTPLIHDQDPYDLSPIGKLMAHLYEHHRGTALSEFGAGGLLLDRCGKYRQYLENYCLPRWRHLSVGDHIPETVEHGRGHVQRLLELTQQLLLAVPAINNRLGDDQFFVLVSSIWLHDLGHSGDCFCFEGSNGLVQKKGDLSSTAAFYTYGDPDKVRRYHHCLTYELLKAHPDFLFPPNHDRPSDGKLFRSVQLACLYHRQKMPVTGGADVEECHFPRGIKDFTNSEVIADFPLVAGLLRFIDGMENQSERSGSEAYHQVAGWVIDRQVQSLNNLAEELGNADPHYQDIIRQADFKAIQIDHYRKHRNFRHVFLVAEADNNTVDQCGIYGEPNLPLIGVYLVGALAPLFNEKEAVENIVYDFLNEYKIVKELLPFRLAVFIVQEDGDRIVKKQVVVRNFTQEKTKWSYELKAVGAFNKT